MFVHSIFLLLAVVIYGSLADKSDIANCRYTSSAGKTIDLSPLIASNGSYEWQEKAYTINGYSLDSLISDDLNTYFFALQVCKNIQTKPHPSCNETGSIFMMTKTSCTSMGNAEVAMFQSNPFGDGVYLAQYHGQSLNHIARYSSHLYFVCNPNVTMETPIFEHIHDDLKQAHFKIFTKYAC
ncbi:uncharacterized protein LOC135478977 [Liolophura sinensis]|uniref:uncharacterized protein LOC135478977 n=1 Tax=Liolophura sinensis TaxID=3198878 RepID=UPI003158CD41